MRSVAVAGALVALAAAPPAPAALAQARRVTAVEASAGGAAVAARHTFLGAAVGAAYRPAGQARVGFAARAGVEDGRGAGRGELTAQFLVTPSARQGTGLYGGLGLGAVARRGAPGAAYLALLVGIEAAPGRRGRAWYAEVGLGGGVRAEGGWRWRRFPSWWDGR